ncbi:hypothetical protein AVEN_93590-1, partial [Araneus ventricosus]
ERLRWPSGKCRPQNRRVPGLKPYSTEDPSCIVPVAPKSYVDGQTSFRWCGTEVWRSGYQLGCHPRHLTVVQNYEVSPNIALILVLKRDVNVAKLQ